MKHPVGIIGGTGLTSLGNVNKVLNDTAVNIYGETSAPPVQVSLDGIEVIFLARHGVPHVIPPHKVNYRANVYALRECGIENVISINAVGGITKNMVPGTIVVPDQIIDYTWSRQHTFFEDNPESVTHVDFTRPYCDDLREEIITTASNQGIKVISDGTYGATQGPRLETAAEIKRLENDGCDIVGMTGMPEATLARELEINYVSICLVVNRAAGKTREVITMELIKSYLDSGMEEIMKLIKAALKSI